MADDLHDLAPQLDVLHGICHAFGSITDADEANRSVERWLSAATAEGDPLVTIFTNGADGRLKRASAEPSLVDDILRAQVLDLKAPDVVPIAKSPKRAVAVFPMVSRGESLGVVEIAATSQLLRARWATLEAIVSQFSIVVRNLRERETFARHAQRQLQSSDLASTVLFSSSPEQALTSISAVLRQKHVAGLAVWAQDRNTGTMDLIDAAGFPPMDAADIWQQLRTVKAASHMTPLEKGRLKGHFAALSEADQSSLIEVGRAVIALADPTLATLGWLDSITPLLEEGLDRLAAVQEVDAGVRRLDMGLAWTAHELSGPLAATRLSIEGFLQSHAVPGDRSVDLLRRSRDELEHLEKLVHALLASSGAGEDADYEPTNLMHLVHAAADGCGPEYSRDRVVIEGDEDIIALIDPLQMRVAIANLVRNALAYSAPDQQVIVTVSAREQGAAVSVFNGGEGIAPGEAASIFNPFVRGKTGARRSGGRGLGLFIVRRIADAHGASVRLESSESGTTFWLELPEAGIGQPESERDEPVREREAAAWHAS